MEVVVSSNEIAPLSPGDPTCRAASLNDAAANLIFMENGSARQIARLPDGQRIIVDKVHSDGYVTGGRIDGEREGSVVVCAITKPVHETA